jgi:hypothetical protein
VRVVKPLNISPTIAKEDLFMQTIANHSDLLLKLDLQLFGDEDMILPDDFEMPAETIEPVETFETPVEPVEDTKPPEETVVSPFLKLKYNHEELDVDEEKARELAQMGMNYPKLQEKLQALESDPRLSFVEELAKANNMDVPAYLEAVKQQREEERLDELLQKNIPEEYAREMLDNRKFRQEFESEKQTKAQEAKANAEFSEFFTYFKQANDRDFNADKDEIPQSVWEANHSGVPLKFAYMEHQNNQFKSQLQTFKQNQLNASKSPVGSVTAHGSTEVASEDDFMRGFNSI